MLLSEGIKTTLISTVGTESTFSIDLENCREWSILGSPHGGMLISVLVNSMSQLQLRTNHPDPVQLTAYFLSSPKIETLVIKVNLVRKGRGFTNLSSNLYDKGGKLLVMAQAIYTSLPEIPSLHSPPSAKNPTLLPLTPSKYASISPLLTHPSVTDNLVVSSERGRRWSTDSILDWEKLNRMKWLEDEGIKEQRIGDGTKEKLKLEWGSWFELNGETEVLTMESLPFYSDLFSSSTFSSLHSKIFADRFLSVPELLPVNERVGPTWFPTMSLTLQWHARLPSTSTSYQISDRTVGIFSSGKVIHEGRHQQDVEIWSAPCRIGENVKIDPKWREKSMLLITSTQLALCLPAPGFESSKL